MVVVGEGEEARERERKQGRGEERKGKRQITQACQSCSSYGCLCENISS